MNTRKYGCQFWAATLACLVVTAASAAEVVQMNSRAATAVAVESLNTMRGLIEMQNNFREMGFESPAELSRAQLGTPFNRYMVRLDELGEYDGRGDPNTLLHPTGRAIYPITVDGQAKSSVTIAATEKGLQAVSYGGSNEIAALTAAREAAARESRVGLSEHFAVDIPALRLYFDAYRRRGELMLVPLLDNPSFDLTAGRSVPAREVFRAIAPAARNHPRLPG